MIQSKCHYSCIAESGLLKSVMPILADVGIHM